MTLPEHQLQQIRDDARADRYVGRARVDVPALLMELDAAHEALRSLACWLGVGGYNVPEVDAAEFERKIRFGLEDLVRVETARARGPQISDSEHTTLLRRTITSMKVELDQAQEACDR